MYNLTNEIKDDLEFEDINREDIIFGIFYDRNTDMYPCDGYIFCSRDKLFVFEYPQTEKIKKQSGKKKYKILQFDMTFIKDPEIFPLAIGGIFNINYKNEPLPVAAFSNSYQKEMHNLIKLMSKLMKGEEITENDLKSDKKDNKCPTCNKPYPDQNRKVCPACMDKRSLFFRVLSYFKPYKIQFAVIILCIFLHSGLSVVLPYLSGNVLYDKIISSQGNINLPDPLEQLEQIPALMLLVVTIFTVRSGQQIFGVIQGRTVADIVPRTILKIKSDVYNSMQKLSLSFFNKRQTGSLLTRIQSDASEVMSFFIDGLPYFVINIIILITSAFVMISLNPYLALFSLVFIPVLFLLSYTMIPKLWNLHGRRHRSVRNMNAAVQDNLTGARVVKAFGQEDRETERFDKISNKVRDAEMGEVGYDNKFYGIYNGVQTFSIIVIWGLGSWFVINRPESMTYGTLVSFTGYAAMLNGPLDFMSMMFRWWAQSLNSAQRIFEVIDAVPEVEEAQNPVRKKFFDGKIELKNVSFSYDPGKPVLKDLSFKINPGEYFGIVGKTGAGKTTLINLISRFYDPVEGEIFIDDIPLKNLSFEDLRRNIAVVSQDTYIFKGTIAQNIAYAKPGCKTDEIIFAAMASGAHDFISKLPHGYDTITGTGGKEMSGGEKQRISIARAILANPKILILDEATASVDTLTEQKIQKSINNLTKGKTTISIAHRLSTLKNADQMIVIEDSQIKEQGNHDELLSIKGSFYDLLQLQTKALLIRGNDEK